MKNKHGVEIGWLSDKIGEEHQINQIQNKKPVSEESERSRREYWSTYWRKKNHVAQGCASW